MRSDPDSHTPASREGRAGTAIRIGSTADIDTLAAIDLDASTLFERAGLHLDSGSERELMLAERKRWLTCLAAGTLAYNIQPPELESPLL